MRQQRTLQALDEMLSSLRIGNEDNFAKVKTAIADLRAQTDNVVAKLGVQTAAPSVVPVVAPGQTPTAVTVSRPPQGYITAVDGSTVMIDMGSAQGLQQGSRLAVYKATDPNTRVGVIEVTQVESGNAHARIVTMNSGVKPEFSDVVRVE
jgi:hypothetical protein